MFLFVWRQAHKLRFSTTLSPFCQLELLCQGLAGFWRKCWRRGGVQRRNVDDRFPAHHSFPFAQGGHTWHKEELNSLIVFFVICPSFLFLLLPTSLFPSLPNHNKHVLLWNFRQIIGLVWTWWHWVSHCDAFSVSSSGPRHSAVPEEFVIFLFLPCFLVHTSFRGRGWEERRETIGDSWCEAPPSFSTPGKDSRGGAEPLPFNVQEEACTTQQTLPNHYWLFFKLCLQKFVTIDNHVRNQRWLQVLWSLLLFTH